MSELAFVTGWAGYPEQFPRIAKAAGQAFLTPFLQGEEGVLAALERFDRPVLLAWSTGAHIVMKHAAALLPRYELVVLVAAFARFSDHVPARIVRRMRAALLADPAATLCAFHANCGEGTPPAHRPEHLGDLAAGLDFLVASEAVFPAPVAAPNLLLIHGRHDQVVPAAASEELLPHLPGARPLLTDWGHKPPEAALADVIHEATHRRLF